MEGSYWYFFYVFVMLWTNFSQQDKPWAEFSTLEVAVCGLCNFGVISKTA
jgi:hypothetical protein